MKNDEYALLPGTNIEVRDVTEKYGAKIAKLIKSDPLAARLNFPRLRFSALPGLGYKGSDFIAIANLIAPGKIEIYETREDQAFKGKFCSYGKLNFYVFTPEVTVAPLAAMRTIIHETAHAVQDWKKWRESGLDREVDAHFSDALYLVLGGREKEAANDLCMSHYIIAAQLFKENPRYLSSLHFRRLREKMRTDVFQHYQFMNSLTKPDFDYETFNREFKKRQRLDGIPV